MSIVVRFSPTVHDSRNLRRNQPGGSMLKRLWPPDGLDYHVCFGSDGDLARQRDLGLSGAVRGVR